jgi:hypothetical protein
MSWAITLILKEVTFQRLNSTHSFTLLSLLLLLTHLNALTFDPDLKLVPLSF